MLGGNMWGWKFAPGWCAALVVAFGVFGGNPVSASDLNGSIARGGRLYDNWFSELKLEKPTETHPAWPASNDKQKGAATWRCKNCHGWDYMGRDGAYATGSYQTGIPGIRKSEGGDEAKIAAIITDTTHALAGKLGEQDVKDLALFVARGQTDNDAMIDRASKAPKGGFADKGRGYYATLCIGCHGADGSQPQEMPESLGSVANRNPWETLHKVVNGQAAEPMPALRALDRQVVADVMAYLVTMPKTTNPAKK